MRTRVKICGITRPVDALVAARCGVDSIGLVFYPPSPRNVEIVRAQEIVAALPPFVTVTGLFLNAEAAFVEAVLEHVPLDLLQFHGNEQEADCTRYGRPFIKAYGMRDKLEPAEFFARYHQARGILVDSHATGEAGGTGQRFDWSRLSQQQEVPLVLAGGITPENVAEAITTVRPWAVDLSSGVEDAPGIKNAAKIEQLMREVTRVDCQ